MSRIRRYKATALLFMFIMGSLVAPFSHYMFMLVSDAYHVGASHHAHEHVEHHHGMHAVSVDGATLKNEPQDHIHCDYWGLFGTFAATTPLIAQVGLPAELVSIVAEWIEDAPVATEAPAYRLRGPPQFLS